MLSRRFRFPPALRNGIAGLGIVLMFVSVLWLDSMPRPETVVTRRHAVTRELFPTVVLDPGHGGQDSGTMCGGVLEKDLTLDVARRAERLLQGQGLATVMTRVGDAYVSPADRAKLTNQVPDCVLVSIHFNEANKPVSSGIETYYGEHQMLVNPMVAWLPFLQKISNEVSNDESQSLAGFIQEALVARTHATNRGTKPERFYVISNVRHPAVLVEGGFLTNKEDMAKIGNEEYREQIAAAIADGVVRYRVFLQNRQATLAVTARPEGTE